MEQAFKNLDGLGDDVRDRIKEAMNKMGGRIRGLLNHVKIETAIGTRECGHSSIHKITKGQVHLAVYSGQPKHRDNYCRDCAKPILDRAQQQLDQIRSQII